VLENRMLRISKLKKEKVTREETKMRKEELHGQQAYSSRNFFSTVKSRTVMHETL
jgi:hypothetical protein